MYVLRQEQGGSKIPRCLKCLIIRIESYAGNIARLAANPRCRAIRILQYDIFCMHRLDRQTQKGPNDKSDLCQ